MPTSRDIALLRLRNQHLMGVGLGSAADVVGWLGAVQAQDYAGARWSLGQRMRRATDREIERAFDAGEILRTHVLRPTWHFVLPSDIRWLLALTAPRVRALMRQYDVKLELDRKLLDRSQLLLTAALRGGEQRTRNELARVLADAGIAASGQRLGHIMMHAELDALICSGARRGKQFTYALLDERAPRARELSREQALAELTSRYFMSHGPARAHDFAWWSGLTLEDARAGLARVGDALSELRLDGHTYYHAGRARSPKLTRPLVHLLPSYDEIVIAYKERRASLASPAIMVDGQVVGSWKRRTDDSIETTVRAKLTAAQRGALAAEEARLRAFLRSEAR